MFTATSSTKSSLNRSAAEIAWYHNETIAPFRSLGYICKASSLTAMDNSMFCANHPKVETLLRCGRCDKPICTNCMVPAPGGTRCSECASNRSSPLYQVPVTRFGAGLAAGLTVGSVCGFLLAMAGGFGFFVIWGGLLYGGAVGEAVLRGVSRKRGPKVEVLCGICAAGGLIIGLFLQMLTSGMPLTAGMFIADLAHRPFYIVA